MSEPIVVCLGYPALLGDRFVERVRAIDPRFEVVGLPVDPGTDWVTIPPDQPHEEPPPWAIGRADERRSALERAEVLIQLHTPRDLMTLAPRLRWLQGFGAGVDQFVVAGVTRDRVIVTNASGVSAGSMAEFVIGRLLQIWKRFPEAEAHQRNHDYIRTYGRSFAGSVIGIVGLGSIGAAVAKRARAMGVHVLGLKRNVSIGDVGDADEIFGPDQLHEMLGRCDAVVVTAPATPETHHLIDRAALAATKTGAMLVNVARGSLVDEDAIIEALESGQLSAAALDVFEQEPLPADSPIWDAPNLWVSAHSSVSVDRYVDDVFDLFEDNLRRYAAGEPLRNRVDME
ncbi:MAG: D-2-hydroxyacid dehydrogenase, partial [Actinomycetota bacterium]|nr:D-2-hydroxyacid dehydrogenase [Actinomycetota bacterium]